LVRGQQAKFNYDSLLRTDTLSRYQAHAIAIGSGFLTVDEVRAMEQREALDLDAENEIEQTGIDEVDSEGEADVYI